MPVAHLLSVHPPEILLANLHDRWQDEKDYEDFKEYADVMRKKVGEQFVRGTKRPFGFVMRIENRNIQVYINRTSFGFKVVK